MPDGDDWDILLAGVRSGDPAALRAFYHRYHTAIERVAARAIAPAMLRRFGAESIAHSVCRTVIRRVGSAELEVSDADSLWRLLCAIALNKVRENARYHKREKRSAGRELAGGAADEAFRRIEASEPSPADVAAFREGMEQAHASLDDEARRVLELRLAGRSQAEIAAEMACSERTVRRIATRLETRLLAAFGG